LTLNINGTNIQKEIFSIPSITFTSLLYIEDIYKLYKVLANMKGYNETPEYRLIQELPETKGFFKKNSTMNKIYHTRKERSISQSSIKKELPLEKYAQQFSETISTGNDVISGFLLNEHTAHLPVNEKDTSADTFISTSFIMRLTDSILPVINRHPAKFFSGKHLEEDFYTSCVANMSEDIFSEIDDHDLIIIYLKQYAILLRNSVLLHKQGTHVNTVFNVDSRQNIYLSLLHSFWHKVQWDKLFPSMPAIAMQLNKNRIFLIKFISECYETFRIASIASHIIKHLKLGDPANLILVSFLDFSIFTWMKHFGIFQYLKGNSDDPVQAQITAQGRRLLTYIHIHPEFSRFISQR